jgi:hypothetical protein
MPFEWDLKKAESNRQKHGISFASAARLLAGPTLEARVDRTDYGEERIKAIGEVDGEVIAVVYTWRGDTARIISARRASRRERGAYRALRAGDPAAGQD